jgi:hypothetical protein
MRVAPVFTPLFALCLAAATSGAAQGAAGITGTLRDRTSRQPLGGATISVLGTALSVRSDSAGQFTGSGLKAGVYVMQVRALGYAPASWVI